MPPPPPAGAKAVVRTGRAIPQLEDITAKTGIHFQHTSDPAKKYIVESMTGGVVGYDRDGWPDIYFTNAPSVAMALKGEKPTVPCTTTTMMGPLLMLRRKLESARLASPWAVLSAIMTMMGGPTFR